MHAKIHVSRCKGLSFVCKIFFLKFSLPSEPLFEALQVIITATAGLIQDFVKVRGGGGGGMGVIETKKNSSFYSQENYI